MQRTQNKNLPLIRLIFIIAMVLGFAFSGPPPKTPARAESGITQAEAIIENTLFICFKKGEDETRGKFITACYYVPDSVYDDACTYGLLIFPKIYMEKFNIYDDFKNKFAEKNIQIIDVVTDDYQQAPEGKIYKLGIRNIRAQNTDLNFTFAFYTTDTNGNTAYYALQYATYNTLHAQDLSNEEVLELLEEKLQMKSSFGQIVKKLSELIDSVWIYIVIALASIVVVWGAFIGIKVAVARKNEENINSQAMVKQLVIGIIIIFVLAVAMPLLIKGLNVWIT